VTRWICRQTTFTHIAILVQPGGFLLCVCVSSRQLVDFHEILQRKACYTAWSDKLDFSAWYASNFWTKYTITKPRKGADNHCRHHHERFVAAYLQSQSQACRLGQCKHFWQFRRSVTITSTLYRSYLCACGRGQPTHQIRSKSENFVDVQTDTTSNSRSIRTSPRHSA